MPEQRHQIFLPDFLLIPYQLIADKRIDPMDEKIYSIVYWFEHLKDGRCTASNEEIAAILHAEVDTGSRSVQNSLTKLEELGYITREFKDESRRHRTAIHTNISFRKMEPITKIQPGSLILPKEETPAEFAKRFFAEDDDAIEEVLEWVKTKAPKVPEEAVKKELSKFIAYWTEPTGSGRKVLWQTKPTFEVKRRVATWLSNIKTRAQGRQVGFVV